MSEPTTDQVKSTVLAGAGLLRWGTILSVNPLQKLKRLLVSEKITIPDPVDSTDACSKNYVDNLFIVASKSNTIVTGNGLKLSDDKSISLSDNIVVESVKIKGMLNSEDNAVPKSYIDNAVKPLVTKDYTDNLVKDYITTSNIQKLIEPLATRTYVDSRVGTFIDQNKLESSLELYAKKSDVTSATENLASITFVNNSLANTLTRDVFYDKISNIVTKNYVDNAVFDLVTKSFVEDTTSKFAEKVNVENSMEQLRSITAEKSWVELALQKVPTREDVNETIKPLATKVFVEQIVGPLAEESYIDEQVEKLASKTYVDSAIAELARKSYVDSQVDLVKINTGYGLTFKNIDNKQQLVTTEDQSHVKKVGPLINLTVTGTVCYPIQYYVPVNNETINSNGCSYLILNPADTISGLTVNFPSSPSNGHFFSISTSQDITKMVLRNSLSLGSNSDEFTLTAGSSLHFIYSVDANTWFNV